MVNGECGEILGAVLVRLGRFCGVEIGKGREVFWKRERGREKGRGGNIP